MKSQRKNSIQISKQSLGTLELIKNKMFSEFNALMDEKQINEVIKKGTINGEALPYAFVFAPPSIQEFDLKKGDILELYFENEKVGEIKISSVFEMKKEYSKINIFVKSEVSQVCCGKVAISGEFELYLDNVSKVKAELELIKKEQNVKKITALMLTADPFNRAHERIVRMTIDKADLVVIFLLQSYEDNHLNFDLRRELIEHFIQTYLPPKKVLVMPFKNTNLFSSHQNPKLECIAAHRLGVTKLVVGQNHGSMGVFYDQNQIHTVLDEHAKSLNMETIVLPELVYCNQCKTLVSTKNCPHGAHHHIRYLSRTIKELLFKGIMPPAILMRPELSAFILSKLHPNRFEDIQQLCDDLFANSGLLEPRTDIDFYYELMKLYQTSSMR
ncbi:MAG: sulfate adenylyltransferase [Campylobacter sp.]|nr:sulfate adenylyltransferase [Campylobacter sp.]